MLIPPHFITGRRMGEVLRSLSAGIAVLNACAVLRHQLVVRHLNVFSGSMINYFIIFIGVFP